MNTGLDKQLKSVLDKQIDLIIQNDYEVDKHLELKIKSHHINSELYLEGVRKRLLAFDEQYTYVYKTYNDTPHLESKLQELISNNDFTPCATMSDNILDIKRQVDSIFSKYLPSISDGVSENTDGLDLELMDKITPLVPEGKEILLKNIVKELNGSAKGLSDFVIIFTKYRQAIINHNGIEYFQRKGCHFLRKI